jgi:hypothetical protein
MSFPCDAQRDVSGVSHGGCEPASSGCPFPLVDRLPRPVPEVVTDAFATVAREITSSQHRLYETCA